MLNLQKTIFVLISLLVLAGGVFAADSRQVVRVAVLADKGIEMAEEEWSFVFQWLNRSLLGYQFILVGLDHPELRQEVQAGTVDFVITNAGNYSELEYAEGITRLVTLDSVSALSPSQAVGSAVVVRTASGMTELHELRGKHLIAASHEAFCCFQIAARELVLAGIDPEQDFGRLEFAGFPIQSIARAVQEGKADAGIVKTCLVEQMVASGVLKPGELRVLSPREIPDYPCQSTSRLYPDWPFASVRHTPPELSRKVAVALLEMPESPEGYRWTIPAHYAVVDEMFRDLKLGRYANLQQETLEALVSRYRYLLMVIAALIVFWIVHTIRVDTLVARRTRELQRAHEERERMAEAMRERQQALDHSSRLAVLGSMASAIAHELKQPLAAIANFARGIDRRIVAGRLDPEPLRDGCNEITLQSQRADTTIERIRSFARKGGSAMQPVNMTMLVKEAVELFEVAHPDANIRWVGMSGHGNTQVKVDPIQIQQVTFNLLKNAFDAQTARGNPKAAIEVSLERQAQGYRVAVRDQGDNLKEEHVAHLFEPFFTTKANGLGLGLALSKWIIDAHGGTLTLTREATGVCASFWLPEEQAHE